MSGQVVVDVEYVVFSSWIWLPITFAIVRKIRHKPEPAKINYPYGG